MTRLRYRLAVWLVPFVAASLACAGLGGGTAAPGDAQTQAAAAATTGAGIAATAAAAFGVTPLVPTEAALATDTESAAPTSAAAATDVPAGAATAPAAGGVVDVCSLMSVDEATALAGSPAAQPVSQGQACLFFIPLSITTVALNVIPAAQAPDFLTQYVPALEASGITLDPTVVAQLTKDATAGDMGAAINDLQALIAAVPGYEVQKLDGVGSAAFWTLQTGEHPEVALFATQPGALVILILRGRPPAQEAVAQPAMVTIVKRILASLPENFTVPSTP